MHARDREKERVRERTFERLGGERRLSGRGGGDARGVHACGVMYAPCAAGCVRRVAYTSYMPGGSQSRALAPTSVPVTHVVPRAYGCVCTRNVTLAHIRAGTRERAFTAVFKVGHPLYAWPRCTYVMWYTPPCYESRANAR